MIVLLLPKQREGEEGETWGERDERGKRRERGEDDQEADESKCIKQRRRTQTERRKKEFYVDVK